MNFRNCKHYTQVINAHMEIWSFCKSSGYRCVLYRTDGCEKICKTFEPTFKAMIEEAIIEAENRP